MNIKDIAKIAGVSCMTVSRVVNNLPNVDEKTKEKVLCVIKNKGYLPHLTARALRYGNNYTVGILVVFGIKNIVSSKMFFEELIVGITNRLNYYEYNCRIIFDNGKIDFYKVISKILNERRIDGLLILSNENANINKYIENIKLPIILVNQVAESKNISAIISDDEMGAYEATKYLIKLGHRKIGLIDGPTLRRKKGYLKALEECKIENDKNIIKNGNFSYLGGWQAMNELLDTNKDITAVFSVSDFMTMGAIKALRERGKNIPNDFSIVSFDDFEFIRIMEPLLTAIRKPRYQMGLKSIDLLVSLMKERDSYREVKKIILPTKLIIRKSAQKI